MMAEEPVTAQLVASRVASRPLPSSSSLPPHSQEVVPNLQSSQRTFSWSSFWWYFLCVVAFLGAANFVNDNFVNFKIYGFFLSAMLVVVKIYWVVSFVCKNFASTTTSLPRRALGSTSSLALGSLSPTSLQSTMLSTNPRTPGQLSASSPTTLSPLALCTQCWGTKLLSIFLPIFLGWAALACQGKSLIVSASFAQSSSFSSSFPSFSFSFRNQLEAEMVSFKHEQLIKVLLANEAYTLPPSLLKHIFEGKLVNKQLEEHPAELEAAFFKELLPELPEQMSLSSSWSWRACDEKLQGDRLQPASSAEGERSFECQSWELASFQQLCESCQLLGLDSLPSTRACSRSSLRHQLPLQGQSFAAKHKALKLGHTISLDFRGADCQLCFWGKQQASQHQPTFSSLDIKLGDIIVKLAAFETDQAAL